MNRLRRLPLIALSVAAGVLNLGCEAVRLARPGDPPRRGRTCLWVASDMTALSDHTEAFTDRSILGDDGKGVRLFAAANETVSFQVVIDAPAAGLGTVAIKPGPLHGPNGAERAIPAKRIRVFRMLPVKVTEFPAWYLRLADKQPTPGGFYDVLVPVDTPGAGQPFRLGRNERLAVWVDLQVPRTARAGIYRGNIALAIGPTLRHKLSIELKVYDFVLPDARPLAAVGGFDHHTIYRQFIRYKARPYTPAYLDPKNPPTAKGLEIIRRMMVLAHEHRLDLFDKRIRPRINRDIHGRFRLDWRDYDAIVQPYINGSAFADRLGCPAWPIPFTDAWPVPEYYGGPGSKAYAAIAGKLVSLCGRHFRAMGAEEQMFAWPRRGKVSAEAFGHFIRMAGIISQADGGIPVLSRLPTTPPAMAGWTPPKGFAECVDILAPPAQWLDPAVTAGLRSAENPLVGAWLSPGQPPYLPSLSVLASPAGVRAIPWFAMKYRCTGLFLPEVLNWPEGSAGRADLMKVRLFHPGKTNPPCVLPSVRLKRLRRGLQDIAYIWILQQRQHGGMARAIVNAMVRYAGQAAAGDHYLDPRIAGWVHDGQAWILARRLLADEVQDAVHQKTPTEARRIAEKVNWQRFTERTCSLRVERVQTFMRAGELPPPMISPDAKQGEQSLRATVQVSLFNEYSQAVDCRVKVVSLPPGWKSIVGLYSIPRFPAARRREARLIIEGLDLPAMPNGKIPVTLQMTAKPYGKKNLQTEVAFVVGGKFNRPPVIDGRLDDWPTRPRAVAGDFRLLGRRGRTADGLAKRKTFVFVMHDEKNLYFAFRCEEPRLDKMVVRPSNLVHYEQLLACGEDLVEILLDPGAKARGPEDLYHIVIKPNGVMIQEIGIRTDPPLGKTRPFPLGATLAAGRQKGAWIAELKIPRSALGVDGREEFWGANFMRFATQGSEASSWSGAERYFYDPRNLGTMFLVTGDSD